MLFSLVLATVDRTDELDRFLASLNDQTYREFELIVVDQNPDDKLASLLQPYQNCFSIQHLHRPLDRGASKARNLGLKQMNGAVATCPDDDCWYPPQLLEQIARFFNDYPEIDGFSGRIVSDPVQLGQNPQKLTVSGRPITTPLEVLQVPGMVGLFLRTHVIDTVGHFDETLGPGAGTPWGSGEDTDYHLRILQAGFKLFSNPDIVVFHPTPQKYYTEREDLGRTYRYGAGRSRVWKRHRLPLWYFVYELVRSSVGVLMSLMQARWSKAYWHWGALRGKLRGWFSS